jgi:F-type H+-transporting ATPase subunit delta
MHDAVVARKYAQALFDQARETNQILACQQGLEELVRVVKLQATLKDVVNHPFISQDDKKRVLHSALGEFATLLLERFLYMLVRKHRFGHLPLIAEEFQREMDRYQNVQPLRVRSAVALSESQQQALRTHLEKWLEAKVRMDVQVDPSLIGGIVVQTQDRILDQSLKGQLRRLQATLSA